MKKLTNNHRMPMKVNNRKINRIVLESINKVLREEIDEVEDMPTFEVFNDNMSPSEIQDILQSYLYDRNDNCVGRLCDLHFKYDANTNRILGSTPI